MKKKTILILVSIVVVVLVVIVLYQLGDKNEFFCRLTFGKWVEKGVYGEIKWTVPEDYCNRPLFFGLIHRM